MLLPMMQVVADPEDVYCVILHALIPARGEVQTEVAAEGSTVEKKPGEMREVAVASCSAASSSAPSHTVLFSGYVTYDQVHTHVQQSSQMQFKSLLSSLLGGRQSSSASREKILMAGPGGMGQAEVAVQKLRENAIRGRDPEGTAGGGEEQSERGTSVIKSILGSVASLLRDDDDDGRGERVPGGGEGGPGGALAPERLQCALMSLWLPVDKLARNILESAA